MICVSKKPRTLHATSLRFLFSCLLSSRHAELVSASHREPFLVLLRGQILKRVQDDICVLTAHRSQLIAHNSKICRICVISVPMKILYKIIFPYKSSWKVESAQLENFYFPLCCFPNNLECFFVCFLFFINQLPISPLFYLFS